MGSAGSFTPCSFSKAVRWALSAASLYDITFDNHVASRDVVPVMVPASLWDRIMRAAHDNKRTIVAGVDVRFENSDLHPVCKYKNEKDNED